MDSLESLFGVGLSSRLSRMRPETLLKFSNLDARVQQHLLKVYATLTLALCVSALGAAADNAFHLQGFLTLAGGLASVAGLGWTSATPQNLMKRYALLALFAFCQGCGLGQLVHIALGINTGIVFTALAATAAIFVCFSLAALLTPRRSYLYLGGYLGSALSMMAVFRLASHFFGGQAMVFTSEVYLGLLVFSGYVLFHTQLVVEKASAGEMDHVTHALDLLVDVLAIFTRIVIILINQAEKKRQEEANRERRKRRS